MTTRAGLKDVAGDRIRLSTDIESIEYCNHAWSLYEGCHRLLLASEAVSRESCSSKFIAACNISGMAFRALLPVQKRGLIQHPSDVTDLQTSVIWAVMFQFEGRENKHLAVQRTYLAPAVSSNQPESMF